MEAEKLEVEGYPQLLRKFKEVLSQKQKKKKMGRVEKNLLQNSRSMSEARHRWHMPATLPVH